MLAVPLAVVVGLATFSICMAVCLSPPDANGHVYLDQAVIDTQAFSGCLELKSLTMSSKVITLKYKAFQGCSNLESVVVSDSVENMREGVFDGCTSLTTVSISSATSMLKVMNAKMFYNCKALTSFTIPDSVTSSLGYQFFEGCTALKTVTIGRRVEKIMWNAFKSCTSLTTITFSEGAVVSSIGNDAFNGCSALKEITIGSSVASIGASAFRDSTNLETVAFTEGAVVSSIGNDAFHGCSALRAITLPSSVTTLGKHSFRNCDSLTEVILPDSIIDVGESAFYDCSSLQKVVTGNGLKEIGGHDFGRCTALKEITIGSSVASIGAYAFSDSTNLETVVFAEGSSLKTIGKYSFRHCSSLSTFTIPEGVTSIGQGAFYGCGPLKLRLPDSVSELGLKAFAASSLESIVIGSGLKVIPQQCFHSCFKLKTVEFGSSLTEIQDHSFLNCTSLEEVDLMSSPVTKIGKAAFYLCKSVQSLWIPRSVTTLGLAAFAYGHSLRNVSIYAPSISKAENNGIFVFCASIKEVFTDMAQVEGYRYLEHFFPSSYESIEKVTIGDSVKVIGYGAFYKAKSLKEVIIPSSVVAIHDFAFQSCANLTSVVIPDSVTNMTGKYIFNKCYSLQEVRLPKSITSLGKATFQACRSLKALDLPESVTEIGSHLCYGCSSLTRLGLPKALQNISASACSSCTSLTTLSIPESTTAIGAYAFFRSALTSVRMPDTVTYLGKYALAKCSALESVTISSSLTVLNKAAFWHAISLKEVIIPESITSIGSYAFKNSTSLEELTIPAAVKSIDQEAFAYCTSLKKLTIKAPDTVFSRLPFHESTSNIGPSNVYLTKNLTSAEGFPSELAELTCFGGESVCVCKPGYGSSVMSEALMDDFFNCVPCAAGATSTFPSSQKACEACKPGFYTGEKASPSCSACKRGTFNTKSGSNSIEDCTPCSQGSYGPSTGASECIKCPPGNMCIGEGGATYQTCKIGEYQDRPGSTSCRPCPAGRYQNQTGFASCVPCPTGTFLDGKGANSSSQCLSCPSGTYGDKSGLPQCTRCPTGQVQPSEGQDSCKECTLEGKIKTNNEAHTACIDNKVLLSTSMVIAMFNKGVALSLAFAAAVVFLALAVAVHKMKAKYSSDFPSSNSLASLEIHQVIVKSALPGFSFGSEVVLIWGMMTEARGLGGAMMVFRLLHPITAIVLTYALYAPSRFYILPEYLREMIRKAPLHEGFMQMNVPPVGLLLLASACDVSVLQLMPWEENRFYTQSIGYPSMDLMLICMSVKMVQSLVSVVCQCAYLTFNSDLNDPTMSYQARALFGLSIGVSVVTLIMGGVILLLKWALLKKLSKEMEEETKEVAKHKDSTMELADVYKGKDEEEGMDGGIGRVANPMHSAAMSQLRAAREDNAELRNNNAELRGQNARLKERLREHGTLEDGDDFEVEENTATLSIPQQDDVQADESNAIPATDAATVPLAGFDDIPGGGGSLDRQTQPRPQPQTSRATAENDTVEVSVEEL